MKYNQVALGFYPSVARLLGYDPTPRPTCLVYRVDKLEVEKVQRHATKLVAHIMDDPYEYRLKALEFRRKCSDMIQMFYYFIF